MANDLDRVQRFVESHPGFFDSRTDHAVVIKVECLDTVTRDTWLEYSSVWTIAGARMALGY